MGIYGKWTKAASGLARPWKDWHPPLLFGSLTVMKQYQTAPQVVWMAGGAVQDCYVPWKWLAGCNMAAFGSGVIGGGVHPLPQSFHLGAVLFRVLPGPSRSI